jgi:hypothetical protein
MTDPFAPWRAGLAFWRLAAEAQTVIALRVMGAWGMLPARPGETRRMAAEKGPAFARAAIAAAKAAGEGRAPLAVAEAGMRPLRRRTGANLRRLTRPPCKPA